MGSEMCIRDSNNSISNVTSFPLVPSGSPVLLSTATASSSSSIEFTSGIDSTYDIYKFEFINVHPQTDATTFNFNLSTDSGSNYNVTKTTTSHYAYHYENDSATLLAYWDTQDLAQSTSDKRIMTGIGNANDESGSGELYLFAPSSTTYVKHFICTTNFVYNADLQFNSFTAGYGNTTSAVNAVIFRFASGNIDAGTIKMYGIKA